MKDILLSEEVGSLGPDKAIVGVNHLGRRMVIDRSWRPHTFVSGESGGGKGGLVRALQIHDVKVGHTVKVLQPKMGENGWLEGVADVGETQDDWCDMLSDAVREQNTRQKLVGKYRDPKSGILGLDKISEHPDAAKFPRWSIYLDELSAITGKPALLQGDKAKLQHITTCISEICARGRSTEIGLTLMSQRPTIVANFYDGDAGGAIFTSVVQRIHFDRKTDSLVSIFDHCSPPDQKVLRLLAHNVPGRCGYAFCDAADGSEIMAGQVMWVTKEQARPFVLERLDREQVAV